jgi:hypothetical protein
MDWLAPVSTPMIMGAQLAQMFVGSDSGVNKLVGSMQVVIDSLMTNSIFDNRTLRLGAGDSIGSVVGSVLTNGMLQSVPSTLKAFNRALDPYVRNSYSPDALKNFFLQFYTFVPFLSYKLDPKLDIWGQPVKQSNLPNVLGFAERVFMNMFSPFINTKAKMDSTTKEVTRVYEATKGMKVTALPSVPSASFANPKNKENPYALTGDDYIKYIKDIGELRKKEIDKYIKSEFYKVHKDGKPTTDKERAEKFSKIYEDAVAEVKEDYIKAHPLK